MEERRRSQRVHTHLHARWETSAGVRTGIIINGSAGGCFVSAQVEEPDEVVRLAVRLPGGEVVRLCGEVSFYLPTRGFGLYFPEASGEDQAMLDTWQTYLRTLSDAGDDSAGGSTAAAGDFVTTAALVS